MAAGRSAVAAADGFQPGEQLGEGERLDEVIVGRRRSVPRPAPRPTQGGQRQDGRADAVRAEFTEDVQPGHLGQEQVEDDGVVVAADVPRPARGDRS